MRVHNLNGTSDSPAKYPYSTWIGFWKAHTTKKMPNICPRCGQPLTDVVGAHVQKDAYYGDRRWYITPLCRGCNKSNTSFDVDPTYLVAENQE